ncbi:MAG: LuxR C-terminal-related transcriptional regulator [Dehalococcoidia bacterium]
MTDRETWKHAAEQVPLVNPRQRQVLDLIVAGHTNQEIADRLDITLSGAKWHVSELLSLFGFFSREELAEFWAAKGSRRRFGLLSPLLQTRWMAPLFATLVCLAIAVPWLLLRTSVSETPPAVATTDEAESLLPPSLSVLSEQLPLPAKGPGGILAYLNAHGDLIAKPMPTGSATVIRHSNGLRTPKWSPSGDYLAVVEQGTLIVLNDKGTVTTLAEVDNDREWGWSPTQDLLAIFTADGMRLFDAPSGTTRVIRGQGSPLPEHAGAVIWSPDGTALLYQLSWSVGSPGREQTSELRIFDLPTGQDRLLVSEKTPPLGGTSPAGWSGDGRWVYFREAPTFSASGWVDGVPLMAMPANGGEKLNVGIMLAVDGLFVTGPGESAAFIDGGGRFAGESEKQLKVVNGATIGPTPGGDSDRWAAEAAWAPNGQELVVVEASAPTQPAAGGDAALAAYMGRKLWLRGPRGAKQLTSDSDFRDEHPLWASDGKTILFVRINEEGSASIWTLSPGSGQLSEMVDDLNTGARGVFGTYGWMEWNNLMDWWQP